MQKRTYITDELREISPIIAGIGSEEMYRVPPGYFDLFSTSLLLRIKNEAAVIGNPESETSSPVIANAGKQLPFDMPDGYFEGFAAKMMSRIKAENAETVQSELEAVSPLLNRINRQMPFNLPVNYFDSLADQVTDGIRALEPVQETLGNEPAWLYSLKDKKVYTVPAGYFEGFADAVLAQTRPQQAKVIPMRSRKSWLRYAAAAVVIGIISTASVFFFRGRMPANNADAIQNLSKVSDQEMINYLDDQSTPAVSADEGTNSLAAIDINENDTKDLFSNVPDNELQQYVEEYGRSTNLITN